MKKETSFPAKVVTLLAIVGGAIVVFWFLGKVSLVFVYFSVAAVISFILNPFVDWLEKHRVPRSLSILTMFVIFAGLVTLAVFLLVPRIVEQVGQLTAWFVEKAKTLDEKAVRGYVNNAQGTLEHWGFSKKYLAWAEQAAAKSGIVEKAAANLQEIGGGIVRNIVGGIFSFISYIPGLIIIPVLVYYFLKDAHKMRKSFIASLPENWRDSANGLMNKLSRAIGGFINGQIKLCAAIGILAGVTMAIAGMPYALIMGVIAACTEFVPYLGPILGMVLPIVVAAFIGWKKLILVVAIFAGIQMAENNIIAPRIMSSDVDMHPTLIIFVLMAGGEAGGIPGMLTALPIAVMLKAVYEHFYVEKYILKPAGAAAAAQTGDDVSKQSDAE